MKRIFLLIFPFLTCITSPAQELNSVYDNNAYVSFEKYIYTTDSSFHTSVKPYFIPEMKQAFNYDSVKGSYGIERYRSKKVLNLIFNRNLFVLKKKEYGFTIDPQVDFEAGYDWKNSWSSWVNTRGFVAEGYIGKNFAFSTRFYRDRSKASGVDQQLCPAQEHSMPGQGGVKSFGINAWDYENAAGYISYSPSKFFPIQPGGPPMDGTLDGDGATPRRLILIMASQSSSKPAPPQHSYGERYSPRNPYRTSSHPPPIFETG